MKRYNEKGSAKIRKKSRTHSPKTHRSAMLREKTYGNSLRQFDHAKSAPVLRRNQVIREHILKERLRGAIKNWEVRGDLVQDLGCSFRALTTRRGQELFSVSLPTYPFRSSNICNMSQRFFEIFWRWLQNTLTRAPPSPLRSNEQLRRPPRQSASLPKGKACTPPPRTLGRSGTHPLGTAPGI